MPDLNHWADYLWRHLSFGLGAETIGFGVAFFDLFWPSRAHAFEQKLKRLRSISPRDIWAWIVENVGHPNDPEPGRLTPFVLVFETPAAIVGILRGLATHSFGTGLGWFVGGALASTIVLWVILIALKYFLQPFSTITNGRPFAGMGTVCAGIGFALEVLRTFGTE